SSRPSRAPMRGRRPVRRLAGIKNAWSLWSSGEIKQTSVSIITIRVPRELAHALCNTVDAHLIGVPHRASAPHRKTVAGQVNDSDVRGALSDTFLQNLRSLIDERIDEAVDDLL